MTTAQQSSEPRGGQNIRGHIHKSTLPHLLSILASHSRHILGEPIPAGELGRFFERLAIMLRAGMEVRKAIPAASQRAEPEVRAMMEEAAGPMSRGVPLHVALEPYARKLPAVVLPVLEVGQIAGTLEGSSLRLAEVFGKADSVEQRFRFSVINPRMVVLFLALEVAAMGFLAFLAVFMPLWGVFLLCLKTAISVTVLGLIVRSVMRFECVRMAGDTLKLMLPVSGQVSRKLSAARWGRSFATMWTAGVPISQALEVSSRSALNAHFERELRRAAVETRDGKLLSQSLAGSSMVPDYLLDVIRTGEATGRF